METDAFLTRRLWTEVHLYVKNARAQSSLRSLPVTAHQQRGLRFPVLLLGPAAAGEGRRGAAPHPGSPLPSCTLLLS